MEWEDVEAMQGKREFKRTQSSVTRISLVRDAKITICEEWSEVSGGLFWSALERKSILYGVSKAKSTSTKFHQDTKIIRH